MQPEDIVEEEVYIMGENTKKDQQESANDNTRLRVYSLCGAVHACGKENPTGL